MKQDFKNNRPLGIALISSGIYFFTKYTISLPDIINGMLLGIAIAGYMVGMYGMHHDLSKLKEKKRYLYQHVFDRKN